MFISLSLTQYLHCILLSTFPTYLGTYPFPFSVFILASSRSPTYTVPYIPTYLPTNLPIYLPTNQPTYIPTYQPTYQPTYLPTYLHTYLPTYQPKYPWFQTQTHLFPLTLTLFQTIINTHSLSPSFPLSGKCSHLFLVLGIS